MPEPCLPIGDASARSTRVCGVGAYRPARIVTNAEIAPRLGVTAEWIEKRSGIRSRRYAGPTETVAAMGAAAAGKALAMARLEARQIDCVLVATTSHLTQMPALAVEIAHELGICQPAAFDLVAACAGFCYGLGIGSAMVSAGAANHVLVIGTERATDILDPADPATAFLFADGAGAVVIGPSASPRIGPVAWGSDGSKLGMIGMTGRWVPELRERPEIQWPVIGMSGWRVFRWATEELAPIAQQAITAAGLTPGHIAAFIPHQANLLITRALARGLELSAGTVVARDIETSGNTSAASIPLAMERLLETGEAHHDDVALLIGFGSGMAYASQVILLP